MISHPTKLLKRQLSVSAEQLKKKMFVTFYLIIYFLNIYPKKQSETCDIFFKMPNNLKIEGNNLIICKEIGNKPSNKLI